MSRKVKGVEEGRRTQHGPMAGGPGIHEGAYEIHLRRTRISLMKKRAEGQAVPVLPSVESLGSEEGPLSKLLWDDHRRRVDPQRGGYQARVGLEQPRYRVAGGLQDLLG